MMYFHETFHMLESLIIQKFNLNLILKVSLKTLKFPTNPIRHFQLMHLTRKLLIETKTYGITYMQQRQFEGHCTIHPKR